MSAAHAQAYTMSSRRPSSSFPVSQLLFQRSEREIQGRNWNSEDGNNLMDIQTNLRKPTMKTDHSNLIIDLNVLVANIYKTSG